MKKTLFAILLIFVGCQETEYTHHTEVNQGVFDVDNQSFEQAVIIGTHIRGGIIDSVDIISKEPVGTENNWYSGNSVYYEIEYKMYYRRWKK